MLITFDRLKQIERREGFQPVASCCRVADLSQAFGGLCNISLNYNGHGFIHHMSELITYIEQTGIGAFVVDHVWYRKR